MGLTDVILFGRGNVYYRKKEYLFSNYNIICFFDNNVEDKDVDSETGIDIFNPKYIEDFKNEKIILLSYALGTMTKQLLDMGVIPERIIMGPQIGSLNSFEDMLFNKGEGKLILDGKDIIYSSPKYDIKEKIDDNNFEEIVGIIKKTELYESSEKMLASLKLKPIDDTYGFNRGIPVDRYYIEQFLEKNKNYIKGAVLEVGDSSYTERFGEGFVTRSIVLNVNGAGNQTNVIRGNLETGEGIPESIVDCFICTQTMQFIFETEKVVDNILKVLKPGGIALVTVGGISQIIEYERREFGHFWNFTDMSLERVFERHTDVLSVDINVYGNIKSATAFMYGLSYDEMKKDELDYRDPSYQVIICAVVKKR